MFKARMLFKKEGRAKYISHLDQMQAIQRSIARANLEIWHTEGFNPHPYISIALPLSTGFSSEYEMLDFNFLTDEVPSDAIERMNKALPYGISVLDIYMCDTKAKDMKFSEYEITYDFDGITNDNFEKSVVELFNREEILLIKKTKRTENEVNVQEFIKKVEVVSVNSEQAVVKVITCAGNPNLSPEYISKAILKYLPELTFSGASYHRTCVYDENLIKFR